MTKYPIPTLNVEGRDAVAKRLGVTTRTLANWAQSEYGPRPVRVGGAVLYDVSQVDAFLFGLGGAR